MRVEQKKNHPDRDHYPSPKRESAAMAGKRVLALFDVDGTLTAPRKVRHDAATGATRGACH